MNADRQVWRVWAEILHRWGVQDITASLLEGLGPLTVLGAQILYFVQPLLAQTAPQEQMQELAGMLENTQETQAFILFLREANHT